MTRLGCSTISFRHRPLSEALAAIRRLGLPGIDVGGLPGVCDHIPTPLPEAVEAVEDIVRVLERSGLAVWALNVDPGPLNDPALDEAGLRARVTALATLASRLDAALIVPCGAQRREPFVTEDADLSLIADRLTTLGGIAAEHGVRLLVEGLHHFRFCHTTARATALLDRVPAHAAGFVLDVSHVVAGGFDEVAFAHAVADRTEHVHLRDAVDGDINLSLGRGRADFAGVVGALTAHGYTGHYVLELETHDVAEAEREQRAAEARDLVTPLLPRA